MRQIVRQIFAPQFPKSVSATAIRRSTTLAPYRELPSPSTVFSITQLMAVFCECLNEHILMVFLRKEPAFTFRVIKAILEDHIREAGRLPKDLQINLLTNLITQFTRAETQHASQRYSTAENLVRLCELDAEFKLLVKTTLFDKQSVLVDNLMVHTYK